VRHADVLEVSRNIYSYHIHVRAFRDLEHIAILYFRLITSYSAFFVQ